MKTRRRNLSGRLKTSENEKDNSLPIPIDLVYEIFTRLPLKSIAICRCVSKTWASILRRQDFTELFLSRSCARPKKLLLAYVKGRDLFFFSAPQPQNPYETFSTVVATYHMKLSFDAYSFDGPIGLSCLDHGFVGLTNSWILKARKYPVPVICNPSTGQSLPLTRVKTWRVRSRSLFGFDPIDKQVKVLSMSGTCLGSSYVVAEEYQVMTLGTRKPSQRMIDCGRVLHFYRRWKEICINGVLYYLSTDMSTETRILVCFDVRSETFSFVKVQRFFIEGTMINYNGKLGLLRFGEAVSGDEGRINLWVFEDIEKEEWSKHVYVLPTLWKDIVGSDPLSFVGMTRTNEIVMQSWGFYTRPLYLFYFNIERNTLVRVDIQGTNVSEIQGRDMFAHARFHIFLDHVENVKLL